MRHVLVGLVVIALFGCQKVTGSKSPSPETPAARRTELEQFASKYGTVVVFGSADVGNVFVGDGSSIFVGVGEYSVPSTSEKTGGLLVRLRSVENERPEEASIDYEEIEPLLKGMTIILGADSTVTKLDRFVAAYITKSGFVVAKDGEGQSSTLRVASSNSSPTQLHLTETKLGELRALFSEAKKRLDVAAGRKQ